MEVEAGSALPLQGNTPGSQNDLAHLENTSDCVAETECSMDTVSRVDKLETVSRVDKLETVSRVHELETVSRVHELETVSRVHELETVSRIHEQDAVSRVHEPEAVSRVHEPEAVSRVHEPEAVSRVHEPEAVSRVHEPEAVSRVHEPEAVSRVHEPEAVSRVHEPEAVSRVHEPEAVSRVHEPEAVSRVHEPEAVSRVHEPEAVSRVHEPEAVSRVHEPEAVSSVHEPETVSKVHELKTVSRVHELETVSRVELRTASRTDEQETASRADELETTSSANKLETTSSANKLEMASRADELSTASRADELSTASRADELSTASRADELSTASRTDELETASRVVELDAEEELLSDKPEDSVIRSATPSEELERDLLGETDSSITGNETKGEVEGEGDGHGHVQQSQKSSEVKDLDGVVETQNDAFRVVDTAVSFTAAEPVCSEVCSIETALDKTLQEGTDSVQKAFPNVSNIRMGGEDAILDQEGRQCGSNEHLDTSAESEGETVDISVRSVSVDLDSSEEKNTDILMQESGANVDLESNRDLGGDQLTGAEDSYSDTGNSEGKACDSSSAIPESSVCVVQDRALSVTGDSGGDSTTVVTSAGVQDAATESSVTEDSVKDKEEGESGALEDVEMAPHVEESMEVMDCDDEDPFATGEKIQDHEVLEKSETQKTAADGKDNDSKIQEPQDVTETKDSEADMECESSEKTQVSETEKATENSNVDLQEGRQEVNKAVEGSEDKVKERISSQSSDGTADGKESSENLPGSSDVTTVAAGRKKRSASGHNSAYPEKHPKKSASSSEAIEVEVNPSLIYPDIGSANSEANKDNEEICIIPDDVPRVMPTMLVQRLTPAQSTNRKSSMVAKIKLDAAKTADKSNHVGSRSNEPRRIPSRPQRQAAKKAESQIKELAQEESNSSEGFVEQPEEADVVVNEDEVPQMCLHCCRVRPCKYRVYLAGKVQYLCQDSCSVTYRKMRKPQAPTEATHSRNLVRKCGQCCVLVTPQNEKTLSWETMDFCNEECLEKYQRLLGSHCANCKGPVQQTSLGKYCVRFGYDIKQFCCSSCLEEFKKGLKVCSYCQKDISGGAEGFLAPVGEKGQFKDFCTQSCMLKYNQMSNNQTPPAVKAHCAVCNDEKIVKIEVLHGSKINMLCSEPCFAAYKFVNSVSADMCDMCKKYFDKREIDNFSVFYDDAPHNFCCKTCMNVYILANRKIVPCTWCKVKKYNFDMIKRVTAAGQCLMMCSLSCLKLYSVSMSAVSNKKVKCDMCSTVAPAQYHLTMSDLSIRNFCNYSCVMQFQGQFSNPPLVVSETAPTPLPTGNKSGSSGAMPVISAVKSLATANGKSPSLTNSGATTRSSALKANSSAVPAAPVQAQQKGAQPASTPTGSVIKQQVVVKPPLPKLMRNKGLSCKPYMHTKGVGCRPHPLNKDTQTDDSLGKPVLIPVPVPIYVPAPMHMYSNPFPVPVPFPLPVPVPIFIPTTRNSAQGIMKEIKRIQEKIPTDPFEAELLMMAEMVAGEKKPELSDSESDDGGNDAADTSEGAGVEGVASTAEGGFSPEAVDTSNTFGEDMLQMALKMASELEEPAVDLEAALTPSTITAQANPSMDQNDESEDDPEPAQNLPEQRPPSARGRKRSMKSAVARGGGGGGTPAKRGRRISSSVDIPLLPPPEPAQPARIEQEKPDANMCLKYTFGVNAWRHWVQTKNAELEKAATNNRKLKLFKPEILQLTADELNYSLCLFVKEVRKPNGQEYAPDTIYYLCLGIQQYLFENGRIDNIFTDSYYEKFTECLDEVARKFTALYNDSQFIVTRVEEEHLWESKQLGAHSPHVLLSTLLFFNTKHFNLTTVDEHMQLSFSHIMKHWKRNPNQPNVNKVTGSARNVLLRFYPPQSALDGNSKKKKLYEQLENEENPLRCPVKLYEFYLSKCPESVKTRNDVFYLLPERSCVPDSPVWYSTMALGREPLLKMLHRVKMVKEINMALLAS